ncbi:MAG: hypothetical protein V1793_04290 [Pseudomonadota bacterium]
MAAKPHHLYWILQDNQTTPAMVEFLALVKKRMSSLAALRFKIPSIAPELLGKTQTLSPETFDLASGTNPDLHEGYRLKKAQLGQTSFSHGLTVADALLLDDLGGGAIQRFEIRLNEKKPAGVFLQIPTPLGSSSMEERIFHAWVLWAKQNGIPVIGYELLPLDTRWTLAPSLLDGIITLRPESFHHLRQSLSLPASNIWCLPRFEARLFSPAATPFWTNGVKAAYHYQQSLSIPAGRVPVYITHNVAMNWDYRNLLEHLAPLGSRLHLMFSTGADQKRGIHDHTEIIETTCGKALKLFASYSFHDLNNTWEMAMAEAVLSCSSCYSTLVAADSGIPVIILDPMVPFGTHGLQQTVATPEEMLARVSAFVDFRAETTELAHIIHQVVTRRERHD